MSASLVTLLAVAAFARAWLVGSDEGATLPACTSRGVHAHGLRVRGAREGGGPRRRPRCGAFAAVYGVLIAVVYFAQLTAVRLSPLSEEALSILDYSRFGLFFSLDLLGTPLWRSHVLSRPDRKPRRRLDRWLRNLLMIHGAFAVSCVILPVLGVSGPAAGRDFIGVLALEFWCAYFLPVCAQHTAFPKPPT
jgi:hypothetical protein